MADEPTVSLQSDGLQPGHDIFCTPNNDAFHASSLYSELDVAQQEIRLVKLWPGTKDDIIKCTLLPGAPLLNLQGQYTAPSYCAGSAKNTEPIVLNGTTFNVFANLAHALREVRQFWSTSYGDRECLLWVDQISINQYDINERSSQVRFMREIYQYAEQVLVCLSTQRTDPKGMSWLVGLASDVRSRGFDEIPEKERRRLIRSNRAQVNPDLATLVDDDHQYRIVNHIRENARNATFRQGWFASYEITEAPWFTRAWVFQEFIVAANVHFMYSGVYASWQTLLPTWTAICSTGEFTLRVAISSLAGEHGPTLDGPERRDSRRLLAHLRRNESKIARKVLAFMMEIKAHWCENRNFVDLLAHSRNRHTSDPRDKVYAYIGLASPDYGIVPNYSHPIDQVMIDTTIRIIETENSLDILWHTAASETQHITNLPSWVADWRCKQDLCAPAKPYDNALKTSKANASFYTVKTARGIWQALQVSGVCIDRLDKDSERRMYHHSYRSVKGFGGACSRESQKDDELWDLRGCRWPVILRPQDKYGYKLVSVASYGHDYLRRSGFDIWMTERTQEERKQQGDWRSISII